MEAGEKFQNTNVPNPTNPKRASVAASHTFSVELLIFKRIVDSPVAPFAIPNKSLTDKLESLFIVIF